MDGNFSQKRVNCAHDSPAPYLIKSVDNLWGRENETDEFAAAKDGCVSTF